jgi:hypothetical protein
MTIRHWLARKAGFTRAWDRVADRAPLGGLIAAALSVTALRWTARGLRSIARLFGGEP